MNDTMNSEKREEYESELYKLDPQRFSKKILLTYNIYKIYGLYSDFILKKKKRLKYIKYITENSDLKKDRTIKWSTDRLKIKFDNIKDVESKKKTMDGLKEYGDGITVLSTPINIQKQRLNFLKAKGSKIDANERFDIVKKTSQILKKNDTKPIYKHLMLKDITILNEELSILQKQYHRNKLIDYLTEYDYNIEFLQKQKVYVLEYLKSDLQPCEKGSRAELIRSLAKKNIWSRNTIRNWDIKKLKSAYIKNTQDNYSPLSEYVPNRPLSKLEKEKLKESPHPRLSKTREEILKDLSDAIFFDMATKTD